jgi:hypothetical protein
MGLSPIFQDIILFGTFIRYALMRGQQNGQQCMTYIIDLSNDRCS